MLRTVWLDKPIRFLKPYRFWLIDVCFLLDVVFDLLPPLCLPQDGGEVFLEVTLVLLDVVFVFLAPSLSPPRCGRSFLGSEWFLEFGLGLMADCCSELVSMTKVVCIYVL